MRRLLPLMIAALAACGGPADPDPVVVPTPIDPAVTGAVRGVVGFDGTPPPNPPLPVGGSPECAALHSTPVFQDRIIVTDGRLANVLVYVKSGLDRFVFAWPTDPATISNARCTFRPRVAAVRVHQPVRFTNEDPAAHNVHGFADQGMFNFTLASKGLSQTVKFRKPEIGMPVKCDLHPWMIGHVHALSHPFFAVTAADGAFSLAGLPAGDYVLEAWHESLGTKTAPVKVAAKGEAVVDFSFRP